LAAYRWGQGSQQRFCCDQQSSGNFYFVRLSVVAFGQTGEGS